jgi:pimeloyl-ACP methyl ester carboxylesterase
MPTRNVNGAAIAYQDRGVGRPLVLLHGFPLDGRIFQGQVEALSSACRLIVPDLRGFGGSSDAHPFTIASLADDMHELLRQIDALPCVLGGLSMGGYVGFAFRRRHAADVEGLILMDTRADADSPEGRAARQAMIELVRAKGSAAVAEQMLGRMLSPQTISARPGLRDTVVAMMQACPVLTIEHALTAMRDRDDYNADLPGVTQPALVLVGHDDAITPPEVARRMASRIPRATTVVVPGAAHLSPIEQPQLVTDAIRQFLGTI